MSTLTAVYSFEKPAGGPGGDVDDWGTMYNDNMDIVDALIASIDFALATTKSVPDDEDIFVLWTGTPLSSRLITWAQIKAALNTHFDARYAIASQAQAEAGTANDNNTRMTPLRAKQTVLALAPTGDNWGSQVVQHDGSLTGQGTVASPLGVV